MVTFGRSRTNGGNKPEPTGDRTAPSPFAAVAAALHDSRDADAVRLFIEAAAVHPLPPDTDMLSALRDELGRKPAKRLVVAFAAFACPHCRSGSDTCLTCSGSGRGEDRRFACMTCKGLGVTPCDFCGGSGLATYNFIPAGLRAAAASVRTEIASERLADAMRRPLPGSDAAPEQLAGQRKALAKQVLELGRDLAILANAAQLARSLRHDDPRVRAFSGRLFARSSRFAKAAQTRMSQIFQLLAGTSRQRSLGAHPADTAAFEEERAELFEEEARRLEKAARRRASLFPGH